VAPEDPASPVAAELWRAYYTEVSDRWYLLHEQRTTPPEELEREIAADDGDGLRPPAGVLLVARHDGVPAGTAGVRLMEPGLAELKRVFVRGDLRGRGGGRILLAAAEAAARELGAHEIVLDTRHDLVEARRLYAAHGYREAAPHNDEPYAEHWFRKPLPR
jgi:GNAT superfamily N-acetyltransferase